MSPSKTITCDRTTQTLTAKCGRIAAWLAVIFAGTLVVLLAWFRIGNLDLGYHIAYGRHFLNTGEIVGTQPDPFLYAETKQPFVNANWGSQVIFALVERAGGATGLFALRFGLIAIIFAAIGHIAFRQTGSPVALAIAWLIAAMAGYERFSLRPELFSYAILCIQLVVLVGGVRRVWHVAALVGLQLLLVNLHSYYLLGVALTLCWVVEGLGAAGVRRWSASLYNKPATDSPRWVVVAFVLQAIACCCHPWHVRAAVFPLRTVRYLAESNSMGGGGAAEGAGSWSNISEFQSPFSFFAETINRYTIDAFVVLLVVAAIGLVACVLKRRWAFSLAIVGFFVVATQMRRNIAPFAFIAGPLAVVAITQLLRRGDSSKSPSRSRPAWLVLVPSVLLIVATAWLIFLIGTGRMYYAERRITRQRGTGYSDVTFPRAAVEWFGAQPQLEPRLYVDYFASSNALLWLNEKQQLFVDTNTFAYADTTLAEAFKLGLAQIPHNAFFDRERVNVVMLHCGPDTQQLIANLVRDDFNWALVYFDKSVVIFVRRQVWAHTDVVMANAVSPQQLDVEAWIASASGSSCERALQLGTMANVPISLRWWGAGASLCRAAVELAPDYHEAWLQLGTCEGNLGNLAARSDDLTRARDHWRGALKCFKKVLEFDPDDATANALLQRTREQLKAIGS
ncbi:MAG: hypothetical protein H6819_01270 [Phycisphaerales bacterium]|nr:hypothetical protein [Phycisphaerales bacterium]MCB9857162.1 hypothetical protein [Phycisphaerales bacterium]MCB9861711.1 hypothetical protein [Phycisphaerales bacterium]